MKAIQIILLAFGVFFVTLFVTSIIKTTFDKPDTKTSMSKAEYLEKVRENNPEYPDYMVCIYDQYIDKHGVEATLRMDIENSGSTEVSDAVLNDVSAMSKNC